MQQMIQLAVPVIHTMVLNKQKQFAIFIQEKPPGGMFMDQNYDGQGTDVFWTEEGVKIVPKQSPERFYQSGVGYVVAEPIEAYMRFLAEKMGY